MKILVAKDGQLPAHETMHSTYPKEKKPIYFQMSEVEVATVFTTAARAILRRVVF